MYRHFAWRHPAATLIIKEDGALERCQECGIFTKTPGRHPRTETCRKLRKRRENERLQDLQALAEETKFKVEGEEIERVREFRYLGRVLREDDDDTICIDEQIRRARKRWQSVARILKRDGANAKTMGKFYLAIVQAVLLYGAESWTITERNMDKLRRFHWRAARYMSGRHIRKNLDGTWSYPDHEKVLEECRLLPMETYIKRRRGTLRAYLEEHKRALLEEAERMRAPARDPHKILWWRQEWITREGMRELRMG